MSALTSSPTGLIFTSVGAKPLDAARVSRSGVKRVYCKQVKGYGVELKGPRTTRMELPRGKRESLGVTHRYLVFQVNVPAGRDFAIEITVSDTNHFRYRLILSTAIKTASQTQAVPTRRNPGNPLHFQLPLRLAKTKWTSIVVDVMQLTQETFGEIHNAMFRCCDAVAVTANCRIRNIFSALENPISVPNAVPAHLSLRMANGQAAKWVFVNGTDQSAVDASSSLVRMSPAQRKGRVSNRSDRSSLTTQTPRLPLPSPAPTLLHAPGAKAAADAVSPSLPSSPPSVKLAFGTRVSPSKVDSAVGPSPVRSGNKASRRPASRQPQPSKTPSRSTPISENYWDQLPRRRFANNTDENDEFTAKTTREHHRVPRAMELYGEGSPLSPPNIMVEDAMVSPSLGSSDKAMHENSLREEADDMEESFEREPDATPSRGYLPSEEHDSKELLQEHSRNENQEGEDEHDDAETDSSGDKAGVLEVMGALREKILENRASESVTNMTEGVDIDGADQFLQGHVEPTDMHEVEDAASFSEYEESDDDNEEDENDENDEEAAARIAYLYSQLELKRRQIARMEADFSDTEAGREEDKQEQQESFADNHEDHESSMENFIDDIDIVNMGEESELQALGHTNEEIGNIRGKNMNLDKEEEEEEEEEEELIFDPILDCYYSPRTNTYFECP